MMFYSKKLRDRVFRVDRGDVTLTVPAAWPGAVQEARPLYQHRKNPYS